MIGKKLAHYEITDKIGEGGMGQVFRAHDAKLSRDVALKILPQDMSGDPERSARFAREARTLASLQHANVASVYGYDEVDGVRFLVMELIDGEDLRERLERGAIPMEEALDIARQIAAGLEAAHENNIVHRDLKPANIKLSNSGDVKVLDFGLARAYLGDLDESSNIHESPTITAAMTGVGTILGTAAYMSPEQARGKQVDARSDMWAFGVILYEMLVGRRLFEGETISDTLAAVLRAEADMAALPSDTPRSVRRLLDRCIERDPRLRLRSPGDASLDLNFSEKEEQESSPSGRRAVLPWALAGALMLALVFSYVNRSQDEATPQRMLQADIVAPAEYSFDTVPPALSPDGKWLAFVTRDTLGRKTLFLRSLEDYSTEAVQDGSTPALINPDFLFWSPDSQQLGIQFGGSIAALEVKTRSVSSLYAGRGLSRGASWSAQGYIVFAPGANSGIFVTQDDGSGEMRALTAVDTMLADASHRWPVFLPDGEHFLFTSWSNASKERQDIGGIYLGHLDGRETKRLRPDASMAVVDADGAVLFRRNRKLMATRFDADAGELEASISLVANEVTWEAGNGSILASVSSAGSLIYSTRASNQSHTLGWLDLTGEFTPVITTAGVILSVRIDSNARYAALELLPLDSSVEIWIADLQRRTLSRLSRLDQDTQSPIFSPSGDRVAYGAQQVGGERLFSQAIDGATPAEELGSVDGLFAVPRDWSESGDLIFFSHSARRTDTDRISVYDFRSGEMRVLLSDEYSHEYPSLSPDGKWLAYTSYESGVPQIYIRSYPELDRKWQISIEGGWEADWNRDGTSLIYVNERNEVYSVAISVDGEELTAANPKFVTRFDQDYSTFVATEDHDRFLAVRQDGYLVVEPLRLVLNWQGRAIQDSDN